jgi:hypothetical protein
MEITIRKSLTFEELLEASWSGARDVLNRVQEAGREAEAMEIIVEVFETEEIIPTETQVNDFIWFELPDEMNLYGDVEDDE